MRCPHCDDWTHRQDGDLFACDCGAQWSGYETRRTTILEHIRNEKQSWCITSAVPLASDERLDMPVQWLPEPISVCSWDEF